MEFKGRRRQQRTSGIRGINRNIMEFKDYLNDNGVITAIRINRNIMEFKEDRNYYSWG